MSLTAVGITSQVSLGRGLPIPMYSHLFCLWGPSVIPEMFLCILSVNSAFCEHHPCCRRFRTPVCHHCWFSAPRPQVPAEWLHCSPLNRVLFFQECHCVHFVYVLKCFCQNLIIKFCLLPSPRCHRSTLNFTIPWMCVLCWAVGWVSYLKTIKQSINSLLDAQWLANAVLYLIISNRAVTKGQVTHC